MSIVSTEDVLHGLPRIEGTRVSIFDVHTMVREGDMTPEEVAADMEVTVEQVNTALEYYETNPEVVQRWEETMEARRKNMKERVK